MYVVLAILLVVVVLASVILNIMMNQSRHTRHQVSRIKAYYAGQACMVYTLEMLRTKAWVPNAASGAVKYACMGTCVGVTPSYTIPVDPEIPYNVRVTINPLGSGISGTTKLDILTEYAYTGPTQ